MFRMLIDTSVWLDLAKDQKQVPVLDLVEEMIKRGLLSLIVPRVVIDEFQKNHERVAKESAKSLSAHFRLVKEAIGKVSGDKKKTRVILSHLDDVNHKIPILGGAAVGTLNRIERILTAASIIEASVGKKKGSGIFSCNCARRKLNQTFRFSCRVSRAATRNNSEDPRCCSLQRSERLRLDQGRAEKSLIFAQPSL